MRQLSFLAWVLIASVLLMASHLNAQDPDQIAAIQKLQQASQIPIQIAFDEDTGVPNFIQMRVPALAGAAADVAARQFLEAHGAVFGMRNPVAELAAKSAFVDNLGLSHVRTRQMVSGFPLFGRELIVHLDQAGNIYAANGEFTPRAQLNATKAAIGPRRAIRVAIDDIGPAVFRWDTVFEEMLPDGKSWRPAAELMAYEHNGELRLVYHTMIAVEQPEPANWVYFIDAVTGSVLHRYNDLKHVDAVGTGNSLYRGAVNIGTNRTTFLYEMKDNLRDVWTHDARSRQWMPGLLMRDRDNVWGDGTKAHPQSAAVDAHWGAEQSWDYFQNTHGRNSFDNAGARVTSTVHFSRNYVNAFWNGQQLVYGDGDGVTSDPLVALDIAAHEFTHAVTDYSADLIYQNQSGALNESVSDVFAIMIDRDDFQLGEDAWTPGTAGDALRYLDNPPLGGQPHHMEDYLTTPGDNGGVHTNSGIPNFAAYLAIAGGTGKHGDLVSGIGHSKVEDIWYRALIVYMTPSTDFAAARLATTAAAADLFGGTSSEVQTILDAWTAVGILEPAPAPALPVLARRNADLAVDTLPMLLGAAFPSPANPEVWIPYQLNVSREITVRIHDSLGRLVRSLELGTQPAGVYETRSSAIHWDGRNTRGEVVSSGTYFYTLMAQDFAVTRKLLIVR